MMLRAGGFKILVLDCFEKRGGHNYWQSLKMGSVSKGNSFSVSSFLKKGAA